MSPHQGARALLGRDAELARLRRAWRRSRHGHRQVVLVSGEPGAGKTSVAMKMAAEAEADGAAVLTGRTEERPNAHYQPLADALRGAMASNAAAFLDRGHALAFALPELGGSPSPSDPAGPPQLDREELFDAVGGLVAELARSQPLVLVLDDLQWVDRSAALLLDRVVEETRGSPVLMIGCYCDTAVDRTHPLTVLLDTLTDDAALTAVHLDDLPPEAVAAMVVDPQLADALARRGEGNPLYIEELLRELCHTGQVRGDGSLDPAADVDADLLPRSTEDLLNRRISRLRPVTRRLLAVAAVVGRPLDFELAATTLEVRPERLRSAVEEAVGSGLVHPVDADDGPYAFAHPVARRAVYRRLPRSSRVRLHRRVGEALAAAGGAAGGGRLTEVAAHLCAASPVGHSEEGARYAAAAGDHAMAVLAYEAAADLYGRALALLEPSTSSCGSPAATCCSRWAGLTCWLSSRLGPARPTGRR